MIVKIDFDYDADYMYCPDGVVELDDLVQQFQKWIYDPEIRHPFWIDENHHALCYRADAIAYWLNKCVLNKTDDKAKVLEEMVREDKAYDYAIVL